MVGLYESLHSTNLMASVLSWFQHSYVFLTKQQFGQRVKQMLHLCRLSTILFAHDCCGQLGCHEVIPICFLCCQQGTMMCGSWLQIFLFEGNLQVQSQSVNPYKSFAYTFSGNLTALFVVKFVYCEFFSLYRQTNNQIVVDMKPFFEYTHKAYTRRIFSGKYIQVKLSRINQFISFPRTQFPYE